MSDVIISVEGLGKKYVLSHQGERGGYARFSEKLESWIKKPFAALAGGERREVENQVPPTSFHLPQALKEEFWALKDVSFEVKRGEVVGIIGRNGAGKSTLLKILSRITEPTEGRVTLRGRVASLLEVGTGFHPELTGRENIFLNGAILGMSKAEIRKKFDEIVAFAEVERFLDTPVKRYSSGMYVRLAFAVAAHLEPEILVVDEVLAVGDAEFQKKCLGKMKDVATGGRTVLFVSHNMQAVASLCSTGILLIHGKLSKKGKTDEVVGKYLVQQTRNTVSRRWSWPGDAPGDHRVRLLSVSILQDNQETNLIDINKPAEVLMEFAVLEPCRNVVTGFSFYDNQGVCLFAHCDWRPNILKSGRYIKKLKIPSQTFAEGSISILCQIVFYDPSSTPVIIPEASRFDAVELHSPLAVRGPYKGPWPGLVRLGLIWEDTTAK